MHVDSLSIIMVLILGIVGTGICVYALGYMKDFQAHHPEQKDRRPWFFALMFAFLSAMYNVVLSDNLCWIYTAWEVTTLCSFLLIGFTKTEEAINNAFRQIVMNMLGGLAFQAAILWLGLQGESRLFSVFLKTAANAAVADPVAAGVFVLPVALLAFAGMTKAAQMPFHTWLLGAMVAPTPTSALLHSSTMVKAGCFLLIKLSPLFLVFPVASAMVVLIGGLTFCLASFMAISQSNAKRVLAYSTIANLGLIVACAGVGTPEAVPGGHFPGHFPRCGEVSAVPVRRHRRTSHRQPRHRRHGRLVRAHAAPGSLYDARHHGHVRGSVRHARFEVGNARELRVFG